MPSMSECRQPYLLSNLDLVTESLTLIAGNSSVPALAISYSRCTPVVVSSVTPLMLAAARGPLARVVGERVAQQVEDDHPLLGVVVCRAGDPAGLLVLGALVHEQGGVAAVVQDHVRAVAVAARSAPARCIPVLLERLALPGEDRDALRVVRACRPGRPRPRRRRGPGWRRCCSSPSGPARPSAASVSISTAVWMVMCRLPVILAPRSGWLGAYSSRTAIRPGISCSASWISLRPKAASERSATWYGS